MRSSIAISQIKKSALNPQVVDWVNRVVKNGGGLPSYTSIRAVNRLYNSIKTGQLVPKVKSLICMVPDNLIAATTPLIKTFGNDPWTNVNFVAGDLTINGLKGNASNKYLRTGVVPSSCYASVATAGFTMYITSGSIEQTRDMGSTIGFSPVYEPALVLHPSWNGDCIWDAYYGKDAGDATGRLGFPIGGAYTGYLCAVRTALNAFGVYGAKSTSAHTSLGSSTTLLSNASLPTWEIYTYGTNASDSFTYPSSKRFSFFAIHDGFTSSESFIFYNAIQNMRTEIGGGFI